MDESPRDSTPTYPTPVHALAAAARQRLENLHPAESPSLRLIRDRGRISVNLKPGALRSFLETGRHLTAFDRAEERARQSGLSVDDVLRQDLKEHYDSRLDWERQAGNGRHFHYGALNVGGMGPRRFGRFCLVDRRAPGTAGDEPVWVAEDSLSGPRRLFRDTEGRLEWHRLGAWVAPGDLAAELAILKLGRLPEDDDHSPAEVICSDDDYIEALSLRPLSLAELAEIRSSLDAEVQRRALDAVVEGANPAEELYLGVHDRIRSLSESLGIPWVEVAP